MKKFIYVGIITLALLFSFNTKHFIPSDVTKFIELLPNGLPDQH